MSPQIKGWCPGAYRPMMSGDGLVVRIRPRLARLSAEQTAGLCDLAIQYGTGTLGLTNRANLQIRGVAERNHDALLQGLAALDLLDVDPHTETRRNILTTPFWEEGDLTHRLTHALLDRLHNLPDLPAKTGIAIDTGPKPLLQNDPADFRIERGGHTLILRADGAPLGAPVTEHDAPDAIIRLASWFADHRGETYRRVAPLLQSHALPPDWQTTPPRSAGQRPEPGQTPQGALLGAPFGEIDAKALAQTNSALRVTPWRLFLLEGTAMPPETPFITAPGDPLLHTHACPGAPHCPQATVDTRTIARMLADDRPLHVSGCAKGCASPRPARTFVGRDGRFDLVENGRAWDAPRHVGLRPKDLGA